jgi:hypothetical protein
MYRSLGNMLKNPNVGILFLKFAGPDGGNSAARLRVNGRARIDEGTDALSDWPGAKRRITIAADYIYPNCPRYIPKVEFFDASTYVPRKGSTPPRP